MYVYADLESLLFRCFITTPVRLAGIPVLFKNLTESEFDYINDSYFFLDSIEDKFNYYVAYSFLQIEGRNLLPERDELIDDLVEIVAGWPSEVYQEATWLMHQFRKRTEKAIALLETYSYTDASRVKWFTYKHKLLNSSQVTGWAGTDYMGLSSTQQSWITLNHLEDQRHSYDTINDAARFVATVFNYKGMKPINDEEVSKRKREYQRRAEQIARVEQSFASPTIGESNTLSTKPAFISPEQRKEMSAQDLVDELNFALSGQEDEHSRIVSHYEKEAKRMFVDEKKRKEDLMVARVQSDQRLRADSPAITTASRFLSDAELDAQIKARETASAEERVVDQGKVNLNPHLQRNFGMMAKLEDEDEEYLYRDPLTAIVDKIPQMMQQSNKLINNSTITSPSFEDLLNQ